MHPVLPHWPTLEMNVLVSSFPIAPVLGLACRKAVHASTSTGPPVRKNALIYKKVLFFFFFFQILKQAVFRVNLKLKTP